MNFITLFMNANKLIKKLWVILAVTVALYIISSLALLPILVEHLISEGILFAYLTLLAALSLMFSAIIALTYAYGYKKGLHLGRDVTQG